MKKKLKMLVIHHKDEEVHHGKSYDHHKRHHEEEHDDYDFQYEHAANSLMTDPDYILYVDKHGYHFTDALAEHASKMMKNSNGEEHSWTAAQVKSAMAGLGLSIPKSVTLGDVTYLANMYYADLYPDPFKDEASCLKAAYKIAHDVDGYNGMIFCRWTSDVIGKAIDIEWAKFV